MTHAEGTFIGRHGLELYYQRWLPDGDPRAALAVVHGFGEHSGRYGNLVNQLVPAGYALYAFDLRGHGRSPGQRGYIERWDDYREDVRLFLTLVHKHHPDRPLFLLGHSMGGLIVLEYVLHYPEGLAGVIASGPTLAQVGISPFLLTLSKILSGILPRLSLDTGLDAGAISRDPAVVEAYVNDPLVHSKGTPRLGAEMTKAIEWTQAHAASLRLPCLIVHGSDDRLAPPAGSQRFYEHVAGPDKERLVFEGYYHEVFNDLGKEKPLAAVEAWLNKRTGPAS